MDYRSDVIIIGGGVIGLACAHYLMEKGFRVRILEKDRIGDGASHGNCGLLYFSDVIPLCFPGAVTHEIYRTLCGTSHLYIKPTLNPNLLKWLVKFASHCRFKHMNYAARAKYELLSYSASLYTPLQAMESLACDHEQNGILSVFSDPEKFHGFEKTNKFLQTFNLGYEKLEKEEALSLEPALSEQIAGAWYSPCDSHLRPEYLMASWQKLLIGKGLVIEENTRMKDFIFQGRAIKGVDTTQGQFFGDNFILAAGAWTPKAARQLKCSLPVQPGKGYSITMERPGTCPEIPCMLHEKSMVVTPWKSGYRLGGTMEFSGYSTLLDKKRLEKLLAGARAYMKTPLGDPIIEEWTSLRPMTHDDLPIIGKVPSHDNLVVATGHGMLGLTLATGTGKIVSDLISCDLPEIDIKPFSMERL